MPRYYFPFSILLTGLSVSLLSSCCPKYDCAYPAVMAPQFVFPTDGTAGAFTQEELMNTWIVLNDSLGHPLDSTQLASAGVIAGDGWRLDLESGFMGSQGTHGFVPNREYAFVNRRLGISYTLRNVQFQEHEVEFTCGHCMWKADKPERITVRDMITFDFNGAAYTWTSNSTPVEVRK